MNYKDAFTQSILNIQNLAETGTVNIPVTVISSLTEIGKNINHYNLPDFDYDQEASSVSFKYHNPNKKSTISVQPLEDQSIIFTVMSEDSSINKLYCISEVSDLNMLIEDYKNYIKPDFFQFIDYKKVNIVAL